MRTLSVDLNKAFRSTSSKNATSVVAKEQAFIKSIIRQFSMNHANLFPFGYDCYSDDNTLTVTLNNDPSGTVRLSPVLIQLDWSQRILNGSSEPNINVEFPQSWQLSLEEVRVMANLLLSTAAIVDDLTFHVKVTMPILFRIFRK